MQFELPDGVNDFARIQIDGGSAAAQLDGAIVGDHKLQSPHHFVVPEKPLQHALVAQQGDGWGGDVKRSFEQSVGIFFTGVSECDTNGSVVGAHQIPLEGGHTACFVQVGFVCGNFGFNVLERRLDRLTRLGVERHIGQLFRALVTLAFLFLF